VKPLAQCAWRTILPWVQRYVPEFERRWSRYARGVHSSWRVDETAVSVRGGTRYLYRAVDKYGKTVDSLLCADRSEHSAREFFTKALETHQPRWPTKLNLDGNAASHRALCVLRHENPDWQSVKIRSRRYLNNIVEQDHRAIKRRCAPMLAMKSFRTAATTLVGVELAHRISKSQFTLGSRGPHQFSSLKHAWARASKCSSLQVLMHNLNELFGRQYLRRLSSGARIDHVFAYVVLDDLAYESIQRPAARGRLLKDGGAFVVRVDRPFHSLNLTAHSLESVQ
jgi:transposase-like protein